MLQTPNLQYPPCRALHHRILLLSQPLLDAPLHPPGSTLLPLFPLLNLAFGTLRTLPWQHPLRHCASRRFTITLPLLRHPQAPHPLEIDILHSNSTQPSLQPLRSPDLFSYLRFQPPTTAPSSNNQYQLCPSQQSSARELAPPQCQQRVPIVHPTSRVGSATQ
jgi:hypothetical protein